MESIKYLLTRFSRANNLNRDEFPHAFGFFDYPTGNASAKATVGYKKAATLYGGSAIVEYNRLDLAKLFLNITPELTLYQPKSHRVVFKELLRVYGLPGAEEDDFVNECVDTVLDRGNPPAEVTLVMATGSRLYKGSVKVKINVKVMPLDEVVVIRDLDLLVEKYSLTNTKVVLERRYYHYDFTDSPHIAALRAEVAGSQLNVNVLNDPDVLQECGNIYIYPRVSSYTGTKYNIYDTQGSPCIYNGPARNWPEANPNYNYVSVHHPATSCVGYFLLHYN